VNAGLAAAVLDECPFIKKSTHRKERKAVELFLKMVLRDLSAIAPCIALSPASLQSCVFAVKMAQVDVGR
jgi:hypothetical protein